MPNLKTVNRSRLWVVLWAAGAAGVISSLPFLSQLGASPGLNGWWLIRTGVLLTAAVSIGVVLAPRVRLRAPISEAAVSGRSIRKAIGSMIVPGLIGGVLGLFTIMVTSIMFVPLLPTEFVEATAGTRPPLLARALYGGVTEELLIRWGLMTALVWMPYRIVDGGVGEVRTSFYVAAIVLSATVFGAGHLPLAASLVSTVTAPLVAYVIAGNAVFGLIAGFLYWRHGLEAAVIAHVGTGLLIGAV